MRLEKRGSKRTLVNDAVDYAKGVHLQLDTGNRSIANRFILLVEIIVEPRAVVALGIG